MSINPNFFEYFADPMNFAHLAKSGTLCNFCQSDGPCFDGAGFYGMVEDYSVCPDCLRAGRLAEDGVSTNEVTDTDLVDSVGSKSRAAELVRIIEHCTPALPTWQDREWPFIDGEPCRFVKIASQQDFSGPDELFNAVPELDRLGHDAGSLWEMLPDKRITSIVDGNYDVSFYLFEVGTQKLCTWDCS
jgi:uncharacterized protein CbrC (UPF0167 family)